MCGIAGLLTDQSGGDPAALACEMASALVHRGPDSRGSWSDEFKRMGLAFHRLSVIDPSSAGDQPMVSGSGETVLVFNGEIYNHRDLRQELGRDFRGSSDTETLVEAIDAWGVDGALGRAIGMFAFAVWDIRRSVLTLARDRMGEKPLYYGSAGGAFLFASQLTSFRLHPAFTAYIDRSALAAYFRYGYVPAPLSIYENVWKLPPGCVLTVYASDPQVIEPPRPYWSLPSFHETVVDLRTAIDQLEGLLRDAVELRTIADVPVGAFLSGGIDSSLVVALMQSIQGRVRTFSIGFEESAFDEAPHARRVAEHIGTDHTEHYVSPEEARGVIPELPRVYDEPFADSSQIPMLLVSRLARQHVTVALSGDGGDELFGGYTRHQMLQRVWRRLQLLPPPVRRQASRFLRSLIDAGSEDQIMRIIEALPPRWRLSRPREKLRKAADVLPSKDARDVYQRLVSQWPDPSSLVVGADEPMTLLRRPHDWPNSDDFTHDMMLLDALTYLPDDILVKLDRATMAVSLEGRVPMLDHRLVEFAFSLPTDLKIRNGQGKWILRQVLHRYVPESLFERPKQGFAVPIGSWLRGPLRTWSDSLLDESRMMHEGFLNPEPIRSVWSAHLDGEADRSAQLWPVLMFQSWLETQDKPVCTSAA